MSQQFTTERRVEFCETDAAGIAHFATFFVYMEQAEHALLRHLGLSVVSHEGGETVSWPRVRAECSYRHPVRFEEVLQVRVRVDQLGRRSVTYGFEFSCRGQLIAEGALTAACCHISPGQPPQATDIPDEFRRKLSDYVDLS